jgi:hypothetical protein
MSYCSQVLQFMVYISVYDRVCVHTVDEATDCGIFIYLWVTRIVVYDQICRYFSSKCVECQCVV